MSDPISPGTYLRLRRTAAGLTIEDVAAQFHTIPRLAEIDRVAWITRVEEDVAAIDGGLIDTLVATFPFSISVLYRLSDLRSYGHGFAPAPHLCATCACSISDRCIDPAEGERCTWSDPALCTRCAAAPQKETADAV